MRRHFPKSVMVWAGITSFGKTPLIFVERGVKINAQVYQQVILRDVVVPWCRHRNIVLQQDWAPAHGARTTKEFCDAHFPGWWGKDLWPSNSPDLNPMDYSVWGILESKACAKTHNSVESLKASLQRAWDEITPKMLATIVVNFRKRLKACVAAKGGHFEHLM